MPVFQPSKSGQQPLNIQPKRILVITLRYLGDTLLVTPLIGSLKQAYPQARLDVLLPAANSGMLAGNPDIDNLITFPAKPRLRQFIRLLAKLWKDYDLAIAAQEGDRPTLCAIAAGNISLGFVPEQTGKAWWKQWLLTRWLRHSAQPGHAVLENLRFCRLLNIQPQYRLTPPRAGIPAEFPALGGKPYVVMHVMPQWRFKQWHAAGWIELATYLVERGYHIVLTGSNQPTELDALRALQKQMPVSVLNLAGQLALPQLTDLLGKAAFFIGTDTGITHLAAAAGTMTFALFGPTDPRLWAPWPIDYGQPIAPFAGRGSRRVNNVYLIQGQTERDCLPCQLEGCERHRNSHSECLDNLSARTVMAHIDAALDPDKPGSAPKAAG